MKNVLLGFVAVFVAFFIMSYIVDEILLAPMYEQTKDVWRDDMDKYLWVYTVIMLVGSFFFSFIFSKGYERKGIMEGVRYGLYIGVWMSIGMAYGTYAMVKIPYALAMQWFVYGIIQYVIAGIILALVFGAGKKKVTV